ncbi:MAG: hypothetical protein ACT4ON_12595 [Bacteroidota bacterium]
MKNYSIIISLLFISIVHNIYGAVETKSGRLSGSNLLLAGASITVTDDKLPPSTAVPANYTIIGSKVRVEFGINESKRIYHNHTLKSTITFRYIPYTYNGTLLVAQPSQNKTLEIIYKPGELHTGGTPLDKAVIELVNYYKIQVDNIQIVTVDLEAGSAVIANPLDLYLEAEIETERYYNFDVITSVPASVGNSIGYRWIRETPGAPAYELELFWGYTLGSENYEVEWTYVDNYDAANYNFAKSASQLNYDFAHDATRIITTQQFYRVPNTYERGYILFRVRGVGRNPVNPEIRIEGPWSSIATLEKSTVDQYISAYPNLVALINSTDNFEQNKNWSSAFTFDENGKKGSSIAFMDGVMHSRQSVAKLNTDEKTVIQSTIYDYQGRPAITTLPAPNSSPTFFYKVNQNMFSTNVQYDKDIFENSANSCVLSGVPMSSQHSTGSAKYFSLHNSNKEAQQALVPEGNGFSFVQVEYYPDQQGRIKRQSIPGNSHYLGSGHETKFHYVSPTQEELAKMFGSEVGLEGHYTKDVTVDPNGQVSVSYADDDGKVIATALSGQKPNNVIALDENTNTLSTLSQNLLLKNDPDPTTLSYTATTTFFAANGELNQSIEYTLNSNNFTDACAPLCFDCLYELQISIKDDCGTEILDMDASTAGIQPFGTVLVGQPIADGICNGGQTINFSLTPSPLAVTLPAQGTYHVTKTLRVSTQHLDTYAKLFLEQNTCLQTLQQFQEQELNDLDLSGCLGSTCAQCSTAVNTYVTAHPELTAASIASLYEGCALKCADNPCEVKKLMMLQQFHPGGQYARFIVEADGTYSSTDPYSIYNPNNSLGTTGDPKTWNNPPAQYPPGAIVTNSQGNQVAVIALTINEFISGFRSEWAESLLKLHPEYCEWEFECSANVTAAQTFVQQLAKAQSFEDACIAHLLIPNIPMSGLTGAPTTTCNCGGTASITYPSAFTNTGALNNFVLPLPPVPPGTPDFGSGSIYQWAMALVRGMTLAEFTQFHPNVRLGEDACYKDKEFLLFRGLFMYYNNLQIQAAKTTFKSAYNGPGKCTVVPPGYIELFPDNTGPTTLQVQDYLNNVNNGSDNGSGGPIAEVLDNCNKQCRAYAAEWLKSLAPCAIPQTTVWDVTGSENDMLGALVQVCKGGCDNTTPNGASNINPASTAITITLSIGGTAQVRTFQDVLTAYGYGPNTTCNAYLINMPGGYQHSWSTATKTVPNLDKCGCDKILLNNSN